MHKMLHSKALTLTKNDFDKVLNRVFIGWDGSEISPAGEQVFRCPPRRRERVAHPSPDRIFRVYREKKQGIAALFVAEWVLSDENLGVDPLRRRERHAKNPLGQDVSEG